MNVGAVVVGMIIEAHFAQRNRVTTFTHLLEIGFYSLGLLAPSLLNRHAALLRHRLLRLRLSLSADKSRVDATDLT